METILVTGGSGVLGSAVVRRLLDAGRPVRVLSRRERGPKAPEKAEWAVGDLAAGAGLAEALEGVGVVVHCASDTKSAGKTDEAGTRHLIEAARAVGARPHVVYVSIVGIDLVPFGYYRAKLATERLLEESGLPYSVVRATQFHDLVLATAQQLTRLPVVPVPSGVLLQPVEVGEVADRMAELALGEPVGRAPDFGGPRVWNAGDAVRAVLRASGRRRPVVSLPLPGKGMRALRAGGLLVRDGDGGGLGRHGFDEFLAAAPLGDRAYGAARVSWKR